MKRNLPVILLAALMITFMVFYFMRAASVVAPRAAPVVISPIVATPGKNVPPKAPGALMADSDRSHLADNLNSPSGTIQADLRIVEDILATFRTNFPREGNPVGTNAEIVAVLTGKNKLGLALIPADHPAINKIGELCDRWGTPFFFHAESGSRMAIESAGPDKKRHTADDVVFAP